MYRILFGPAPGFATVGCSACLFWAWQMQNLRRRRGNKITSRSKIGLSVKVQITLVTDQVLSLAYLLLHIWESRWLFCQPRSVRRLIWPPNYVDIFFCLHGIWRLPLSGGTVALPRRDLLGPSSYHDLFIQGQSCHAGCTIKNVALFYTPKDYSKKIYIGSKLLEHGLEYQALANV